MVTCCCMASLMAAPDDVTAETLDSAAMAAVASMSPWPSCTWGSHAYGKSQGLTGACSQTSASV